MITRIFNRIFNFFSYPGIDPDEREKRRIAVIAFIITGTVFIPITIYNYAIASFTTALLNAVTSVTMLLIFILLRYIRDGKKIYRVGTVFLGLMFLFNIARGGSQGGLVLWSFIFPLGTFFMLGIIEGIIWNSAFLIAAVSIMLSSHYATEIHYYRSFFISRFTLSYIVVSLLTIGYESARRATLTVLLQKQRKLNIGYSRMKIELELSKKYRRI